MKIIKYIDFSAQTLMITLVLCILFVSPDRQRALEGVLGMQLIVGTWQILSSITAICLRRPLNKFSAYHLILSAAYLTSLFMIPFSELSRTATLTIFMAPPWILAFFCYFITGLSTFQKPNRQSSFLPHTSF